MIRKVTNKSSYSEEQNKVPDATPFSDINPNAFSTETDRARTRAPFQGGRNNWQVDELTKIYKDAHDSEEEEESHGSAFSSLGLALLVFVGVGCLGTYFLSQGNASDATEEVVAEAAPAAVAPVEPEPAKSLYEVAKIPAAPAPVEASILEKTSYENQFTEPGTIGEFIATSTINGVFMKGAKSRITLNGQTFRVGDVVSEDLELTFIGFHKDRERAVFQGPDELYYLMSIRR